MSPFFKKNNSVITDKERINDILERAVEDVFVKDELYNKLTSGVRLRVKLGIDPTGPDLHIGRAAILRKLKAFQDLGHTVVFIVGDFTAQIGDPSDKDSKRPMLTPQKIRENLRDYERQIGRIIDIDKAEFSFNSSWLSKLGFQEISELAEAFSVQQMMNRRNFKERFDRGDDVSLREFLYPLMQGYDSVAVRSDVEIGGFDQLFNLKAGRVIQRHYEVKEQDVLTIQMLEGTDGRKMSTSYGNIITINDEPDNMFGKIMSIRDDLIIKYFTLCTEAPLSEIDTIEKELENGANPRDHKLDLAVRIVSLYNGEEAAQAAKEHFLSVFTQKSIPSDDKMDHITLDKEEDLRGALVREGVVSSKQEFRRLITSGAITNLDSGEKISLSYIPPKEGVRLKVGKKRFVKISSSEE